MYESFEIEVNKQQYTVAPYDDAGNMLYEIYTNCEMLFTLKKESDGHFKTNENDVIPIDADLIENIGEAINMHFSY